MKIVRRLIAGIVVCFAFIVVLASCSNVSKSYADKVNNAYKNGASLKYEDAKKDLGEECIDVTVAQNGVLIAVKGMTAANYQEKLKNASADQKFEFITITVVIGNCTYAYYASGTAAEITSAIDNGKINN